MGFLLLSSRGVGAHMDSASSTAAKRGGALTLTQSEGWRARGTTTSPTEGWRRLRCCTRCCSGLAGMGEEPELSDEQLHSNDQLQQDEMLALDAIYGDNMGILSAKDGLRCFQVHVHCEIPDGISVSAELSRGDNHDQNSRVFDTFSVQHLAPISLTCLMPPSYPSHHAPYFTLSSQWLDTVKVSSLCLMLDTIWSQQLGLEVVYGWVQWLQSSALSHLGFNDGIVVRQPDSMVAPVDVLVVAEIVSVESAVQWLIRYNEEECHESFLIGLHDSMICFTERAGIDFIKLPCRHYFCRRCMETYSRMHVAEGTVLKLLCPNDKCGGIIPLSLLKRKD